MSNTAIIDLFIKNFVLKDKRQRSELQLKSLKNRNKFTDRLNNKWDTILDMRHLTKIPSGVIDIDFVKNELRFSDHEMCYIISDHDDIDGKSLEFKSAFEQVYGRGFGSLLINSSGDKLYLETEVVQGKQNRFIAKVKSPQ